MRILGIAGAAAAIAIAALEANRAKAPTRRMPTAREMLEPDAVEDAPEAPPPPEGARRVHLRPSGPPRALEPSGPPRESAGGRAAARRRRQMARQKGQPDE